MNKKVSGILFVLFASVMWALYPKIAKLSLKNASFLQLSFSELFFTFIFSSIFILITRKRINYNF